MLQILSLLVYLNFANIKMNEIRFLINKLEIEIDKIRIL